MTGEPKLWPCYVGGDPVGTADHLEVRYPFDDSVVGRVAQAGPEQLEAATDIMLQQRRPMTRHQRAEILETARRKLNERADEFAEVIRMESGLCVRETRYEVGRAQDVLQFAAMEALKDDGQVFSCDITPHGKARKIFTTREPLRSVAAITPRPSFESSIAMVSNSDSSARREQTGLPPMPTCVGAKLVASPAAPASSASRTDAAIALTSSSVAARS